MIITVEATWPPDKATDIGSAFLEAPSLPDYITMQARSEFSSGLQGFCAFFSRSS